jgi:uridine phosphorylase
VRTGLVASTDLFHAPGGGSRWLGADGGAAWRAAGALVVDLETAALLALGARRGVPVGCVLAVAELIGGIEDGLDDDGLAAAVERAGRLGLRAFEAL